MIDHRAYRSFIRGLMGTIGGCWDWRGSLDDKGRARISIDGGNAYASRRAWQLFQGDIGDDRMVLHICDNPKCVNPDHLYIGTHQDNMRDKAVRERSHNRFLTNDQVHIIRTMRRNGAKHKEIAARFNISPSLSVKICKGYRRQHVTASIGTSD